MPVKSPPAPCPFFVQGRKYRSKTAVITSMFSLEVADTPMTQRPESRATAAWVLGVNLPFNLFLKAAEVACEDSVCHLGPPGLVIPPVLVVSESLFHVPITLQRFRFSFHVALAIWWL